MKNRLKKILVDNATTSQDVGGCVYRIARLYGRNLSSNGIKPEKYSVTEVVVNIDNTPRGSNAAPEVFYLDPSSVKDAQISREFIEDIREMINDASDTPGIIYGILFGHI